MELIGNLDGLDEVVQLAGLQGLSAHGRLHLRHVIAERRKVKPFHGKHADLLNGLDDVDGFMKSIKKAVSKVTAVTKAVVIPTSKNLAKAEDIVKPHVPLLLNTVGNIIAPGAGTAAATAWNAGRGVIDAKKAGKQAAQMDAQATQQANALYAQQQTAVEGQYLSKDEPDPKPAADGQWIKGIENKWVLLGTATGLSGLLLLLVNRRHARERRYAA
ncbi:MAG: hypothetical protein PSX71_14035 [bacterium]|nr:hypothetical protein [bacterium]